MIKLNDIPCTNCNKSILCDKKIKRSPKLFEIKEAMLSKTDGNYKQCGIWISLCCENLIDETQFEVDKN